LGPNAVRNWKVRLFSLLDQNGGRSVANILERLEVDHVVDPVSVQRDAARQHHSAEALA
jgi:hypothetical protein